MWDEPATTTETVNKVKRTKETTVDPGGRPISTIETSTIDTAMPKITDTYNTENGTLELQTTSVGESNTGTITQHYNTLGQISSYTDAKGNTANYEYETGGEARLAKISDQKGSQTYTYETATGLLKQLTDSGAGTFTVTRDVEGRITKETLPNGMTASTTFNPAGIATNLEYVKTAHCESSCTWFTDSIVPGINGEPLKQVSSLAEEPNYTYDGAGRLTSVQEIPAGEGCKTRLYSYGEDSERTVATRREPAAEGKCATEGGNSEWHTYDSGDRMTDPGVTYEEFGNIASLPAADAGEHELYSYYYVDGQVSAQVQNNVRIEYKLDPNDRTSEAISTGGSTGTKVFHYDAGGSAVAWVSEGTEPWTRNIPGPDGTLAATQKGHGATSEQAVLLLHDLAGNAVAEAADNETETKLLRKYNSTEFGTPNNKEAPPKYSWLGAAGITSELPNTVTQDGVTYVPLLGASLQAQTPQLPVPTFEGQALISTLSASLLQAGLDAGQAAVARYDAAQAAAGASACTEENDECGTDPSHGPNPWRCSLWVSWGHGLHFNEYLAVHGHWKCAIAPPDIEIVVSLLIDDHGKYKTVEEGKQVWHYPGEYGATGSEYSKGWLCEANDWYQAWVWGRTWEAWTNETNWYATAEDGHPEQCWEGVEDPTPGAPGSDG
jgi:hypothetical protein